MNLADLFNKWATDKANLGYADLYECLFLKVREQIQTVLEIGIGTMIPWTHSSMVGYAGPWYHPGGSLRAWREYFPIATIYGIDVQLDTQFKDDRIVTHLCNSTNPDHVAVFLGAVQTQFDIIIDDGSHLLENQLTTLTHFFPTLKPGGTYVVEDINGTATWEQADRIKEITGYSPFFLFGGQMVIVKRKRIEMLDVTNIKDAITNDLR